MTDHTLDPVALDPWVASSLLQKAIRRGETDLALLAAREFQRHRGKGIWRRLVNIAFEDVGIADPDLVGEITFLAYDARARACLGPDTELVAGFCRRLAQTPKDRSTDYLVCTAIKSEAGLAEQQALTRTPVSQLVAIAANPDQPLLKRAAAGLLSCTKDDAFVPGDALPTLLAALSAKFPCALYDAVEMAAKRGLGSYILMAPLLWSAMRNEGGSQGVAVQSVPPGETARGVPLYALDKHTAVGKRAIIQFAQQNLEMVEVLKQVPPDRRRDVALMAAFYADAVPISRRFLWGQSFELERLGFAADMGKAGCPSEAQFAILACVRTNLPDLNRMRRAALGRDHKEHSLQSIAQTAEPGSRP